MPNIEGLTNPFENSILNSNLTQLEKIKQIENYALAVSTGYEPPPEILTEIELVLASGDLSVEAQAEIQSLYDFILAELAPVITSDGGGDTAAVSIDENTTFVTTVLADDRYSLNNGTQTLQYAIVGGADAALFEIDPDTGELTFIEGPEAVVGADAFEVIVQVSDGADLVDTQTISVTVNNTANDVPVFVGDTVLPNASAGDLNTDPAYLFDLATLFSDADGDELTITATGVPAGFTLVDGVLVQPDPTFETQSEIDGTGLFTISVTADDGNGGIVSQDVTFNVAKELTITNPNGIFYGTELDDVFAFIAFTGGFYELNLYRGDDTVIYDLFSAYYSSIKIWGSEDSTTIIGGDSVGISTTMQIYAPGSLDATFGDNAFQNGVFRIIAQEFDDVLVAGDSFGSESVVDIDTQGGDDTILIGTRFVPYLTSSIDVGEGADVLSFGDNTRIPTIVLGLDSDADTLIFEGLVEVDRVENWVAGLDNLIDVDGDLARWTVLDDGTNTLLSRLDDGSYIYLADVTGLGTDVADYLM